MIPFVCNAQLRKMPQQFDEWLESKGMRHATVADAPSPNGSNGQLNLMPRFSKKGVPSRLVMASYPSSVMISASSKRPYIAPTRSEAFR